MSEHVCTEAGCPDADAGREFKSAGALRFHAIAKHGAAKGTCTVCDPPREVNNLASHLKRAHPSTVAPEPNPSDPGGPGATAEPLPFDGRAAERAPRFGPSAAPSSSSTGTTRGGRLRDRVRGKLWGAPDEKSAATGAPTYEAPTREKRPRTGAKRATAAGILTLMWGGAGTVLERSGADIPVGRTLQFQAPAAGEVLDRLVAGTWLDRVLQPLASKADDVEAMGALFAMPVLVAMVERSPALAVSLEPVLREVVAANLLSMAPVVKKKKADAKKLAEVCAELDPALGAAADPVEVMLSAIFAPPPNAEPAPDVNTNGQGEPASAAV